MTTGTTAQGTVREAAEGDRPRTWRQRVGARLRGTYEEDGVFRPVRLALWADLTISAAIVVFVLASFSAFVYWLAQTQ